MRQFELVNGTMKQILFANAVKVMEIQQYDGESAGAPLRTTSIYSDGF